MSEDILVKMVGQVRDEFQIPSYFPNDALERYFQEGHRYLSRLNPNVILDDDVEFQSLLKTYVYYAYEHHVYEFVENYREPILSWQMGSEVDT